MNSFATFSMSTFPRTKCSASSILRRTGGATRRFLITTVRVGGWCKRKRHRTNQLCRKRCRPNQHRRRIPARTGIRLPPRRADRAFPRGKPEHEEEYYTAGILGLPALDTTAADRSVAPARCHHVRRGDCVVLCRGDGQALLVRTVYSDGRDFAQLASPAGLCGVFTVAHHDRLCAQPGIHAGVWLR